MAVQSWGMSKSWCFRTIFLAALAAIILWLLLPSRPLFLSPDGSLIQRLDKPFTPKKQLFTDNWLHPKGAFAILIHNESSPDRLASSLPLMVRHVFSIGPYPLLVFHPSNYPADGLDYIKRSAAGRRVYFETVNFAEAPVGGVQPDRGHQDAVCFERWGIGYRHMCRFQAKTIYDTKLLRNSDVEYVWRLDDDSLYFGQAPDVFQMMYHGNFLYAYHRIYFDNCIQGLEKLTKVFARSVGARFTWKPSKVYYNNFEVVAMSFMQSQVYRDYLAAIDKDGGIFRYRWGDAPIKTYAAQMFLQPHQLLALKDFRERVYCHAFTRFQDCRARLEAPQVGRTVVT